MRAWPSLPMKPAAAGSSSKCPPKACCPTSALIAAAAGASACCTASTLAPFAQPAEDLDVDGFVARDAHRILLVRDPERRPGREGVALRHHADDLGGFPVHLHRAADRRRVRAESLGPEFVGKDDHRRRAFDRVAREDGAPELGRDAGYVENVAVGKGAVVALGLAVAGEVRRADVDRAECLELICRRFADLGVVARQQGIVVVARLLPVDRHDRVQAIGIRVRRRLQHQRVRDAIHEDHGGEAEAEDAGRERGKRRRARETCDRALHFFEECVHRYSPQAFAARRWDRSIRVFSSTTRPSKSWILRSA